MSDSTPDQTSRLPDVTMTAAGSGREVKFKEIGGPVILIFHGQDTANAALEVNKAVRQRFPGVDEVFLASVIDLRSFPSMFRSMVGAAIEKAYFNAAGKIPAGADPADLVVLLPDWDGAVHDTVGVVGSPERAAVVVADGEARIVCVDQGDDLAGAALKAFTGLIES